ncbi:MAG: KamA family radical SAM protein [Anaerohalosphaera sp.]|nr:KamA family radical SAM protein [Anaerohalosphaera sp.]
MHQINWEDRYNHQVFKEEADILLSTIKDCSNIDIARERLVKKIREVVEDLFDSHPKPSAHELIRIRDCSHALLDVLNKRSDALTGFSVTQVFLDIASGTPRSDLEPGFYAELIEWLRGLKGEARFQYIHFEESHHDLTGREAAIQRSIELDGFWAAAQSKMSQYSNGLTEEMTAAREMKKQKILEVLGATEEDWQNWRWHIRNVLLDSKSFERLTPLSSEEKTNIDLALKHNLVFGATPYHASLMEDDIDGTTNAIRMQVIPPRDYIDHMIKYRSDEQHSCDFMLESDTSPVDLITRRYPGIVIFKPFNACPQYCVYCQRNWEIVDTLSPKAYAGNDKIEAAIKWIEEHPAICEVLITGGDPLMLSDDKLENIIGRITKIPHIDMIRIGTRATVTIPMRITEEFAEMLGEFRQIGKLEIALVTHIEHPSEITLDTAIAVDRLKRQGISVYNQQVFTFYVSRRFETALLRLLLRRIGVDPYYTFMPKGKEETNSYRIPLARMLQEQKEEARLIPGLRRTDEAVYNVPGLGKNYIRAKQHRDLLTVLPNGSRMYEFHPWEKNMANYKTHITTDICILDYLSRLKDIGVNPDDYASIWFYF